MKSSYEGDEGIWCNDVDEITPKANMLGHI